jgi:hypothetical protein
VTIYKYRDRCGGIIIRYDLNKKLFLVKSFGFVTPKLVKQDIQLAHKFAKECKQDWIYIVDTENLKFVHPLNIIYIKEIKNLNGLKKYIVFAPKLILRLLIYFAKPVIFPDRIIIQKSELIKEYLT